jgi:hypothetical protein
MPGRPARASSPGAATARHPNRGKASFAKTAGAGTEVVATLPGRPLPPPVAALMERFGMTEADVLALAMSGPAEDFSISDEVYGGAGGCPGRSGPGRGSLRRVD